MQCPNTMHYYCAVCDWKRNIILNNAHVNYYIRLIHHNVPSHHIVPLVSVKFLVKQSRISLFSERNWFFNLKEIANLFCFSKEVHFKFAKKSIELHIEKGICSKMHSTYRLWQSNAVQCLCFTCRVKLLRHKNFRFLCYETTVVDKQKLRVTKRVR